MKKLLVVLAFATALTSCGGGEKTETTPAVDSSAVAPVTAPVDSAAKVVDSAAKAVVDSAAKTAVKAVDSAVKEVKKP